MDDITLVKSYIGKNADKIYNAVKARYQKIDSSDDKPNPYAPLQDAGFWLSFVFGIFYYLYRKMYLPTIILLGVLYVILVVSSLLNLQALVAGAFIFWPICYHALYGWDIKRKVNKIKEKNPSLNPDQLRELVTKKGGTSWVSILLIVPIFLLFTLLLIPFV